MNTAEWRENTRKIFLIEIALNRLKKKGAITNEQEKEIRMQMKGFRYKTFLNSPHLKEDEKVKNEAELLCLNDLLRYSGCDKKPCLIYRKNST